jgi:hypothetical protein
MRRIVGVGALGLGALGVGVGTAFALAAHAASTGGSPGESQADAVARNDRITGRNTAAIVSFVAGAAAAGTGAVLLLWPSGPSNVQVSWSPDGPRVGYATAF